MTGRQITAWKSYIITHRERILLSTVFCLLPLLCCIIACAREGRTIADVYLPASYWNDELFYYKQVEAMVHYGVPQGYFGFDESRGMYLSFAAWSPVLLLVWTLWGIVFGWTLVSPIYCNIACMMIGMLVFSLTAKPDKKQTVITVVLFVLFTPITRHMLSGMPEAICYSLLIMYMGIAMKYVREQKGSLLIWLFLLSGVLTLMRPYLLLFLLLPSYFWIKRSKRGIAGSALIVGSVFAGYCGIHYFLGAAYLEKLFDVVWLTNFFTDGIGAGVRYLADRSAQEVGKLIYFLKQAIKYGHFAGSLYMALGIQGILILSKIIEQVYRKRKKTEVTASTKDVYTPLYVHMCLNMIVMMIAVLWMYKLGEGSKHIASFIVAAIMLFGMMASKYYGRQLIIAVAFGYFFVYKAMAPYDYAIPYDDGVISAEVESLQEQLETSMELTEGISYDNTVIWLSYDMIADEVVSEQWQMLYALPQGFGINLCLYDYTMEHIDELQCGYVAAIPNGDVEQGLQERGAKYMGSNRYVAVYDIRNLR